MLQPILVKNDKRARLLIIIASIVVFAAVVLLGRVEVPVGGSFDVHVFAKINAVINSIVSVLLIAGLVAVKMNKFVLHKKIMIAAILLSVLFLISYICHHLLAGDTKFGGAGSIRLVYFIILDHAYYSGGDYSSFYFIYRLQGFYRGVASTQAHGEDYLADMVICVCYGSGGLFDDQPLLQLTSFYNLEGSQKTFSKSTILSSFTLIFSFSNLFCISSASPK